ASAWLSGARKRIRDAENAAGRGVRDPNVAAVVGARGMALARDRDAREHAESAIAAHSENVEGAGAVAAQVEMMATRIIGEDRVAAADLETGAQLTLHRDHPNASLREAAAERELVLVVDLREPVRVAASGVPLADDETSENVDADDSAIGVRICARAVD